MDTQQQLQALEEKGQYSLLVAGSDEDFESFEKRVKDSARITDLSIKKCHVSLWSKWELELSLTFPEEDIQPVFSGACWAGTVVWPASLLLCEHIRSDKVQVTAKSVIELGSGIGVPGMTAKFLGAERVLLTEQDPLPGLLQKNVDHVFRETYPEVGQPEVLELDWLELNDEMKFDIILVSDCVYQELYGDSWKALADCIKKLSIPGRTKTYNSMERRNKDGIDEFLSYCTKIGVSYELVEERTGPFDEILVLYEMFVKEAGL
mmetsp:Transcript_407/g.493  ORF Transcript_407/g.493 Transcript_407/m.493 type:complete len:263 (+) Transcript_407:685-1473(+)